MISAVRVKNLSKVFGSGANARKALDNVDLEIREGEVFGLLGPNGAGKTTLISILCGLTSKTSGEAEVLGLDCEKQRSDVQGKVGIMRGFTGVIAGISCHNLLKYYMLLYDTYNEKKITELLKKCGLWERRDEMVEDFSSGFRQRFAFAKALCNGAPVVFLDEPTVGLDVDIARQMREMIKELKKEGKTILLTTHYMAEAEELCDRIAFINHGRIITVGTPDEIKQLVKENEVVRITSPNNTKLSCALNRMKGILKITEEEDRLDIFVENRQIFASILDKVSQTGLSIDKIEIVETPLEEAFLRLMKK